MGGGELGLVLGRGETQLSSVRRTLVWGAHTAGSSHLGKPILWVEFSRPN